VLLTHHKLCQFDCWTALRKVLHSNQPAHDGWFCLCAAEAKAGVQGAAARASFDWTPELLSTLLAFVHLRGLVRSVTLSPCGLPYAL
jgi:hypothetical protein